jgi:nuclear transport factor 2 (NTF2) superfamily protein
MFQIMQLKVRSRDPTAAYKHQQDSHAWFKSHSNTNALNQNAGKQRKMNYGKITEIPASLTLLTLPTEQK